MVAPAAQHKIVLLTGLSGAGKSTATKSLEDIGFRTIDNLPNDLIPALLEKIQLQPDRFARLCLVIDARDGDPRAAIDAVRAASLAVGTESRVIHLDSRDDVLIRRFSETRHRHPLGGPIDAPSDVAGAIRAERALLSASREIADAVIDTSDPGMLRFQCISPVSDTSMGFLSIRISSLTCGRWRTHTGCRSCDRRMAAIER